jgi:hypothetical protein
MHDNFKIVSLGRIHQVATVRDASDVYVEVDDLKTVLTEMGAAVDEDRSDRLLTIAYPDAEDAPTGVPSAPLESAWRIVFNTVVVSSACREDEDRVYLPLTTIRAIAVAMKKRVSDPPYTDLFVIAPAVGEDLPVESHPVVPEIHTPLRGGH